MYGDGICVSIGSKCMLVGSKFCSEASGAIGSIEQTSGKREAGKK